MSFRYYIIDAFAEKAFSGVPVAVFPDASDIPENLEATLAGEMQATDCVFIRPEQTSQNQVPSFELSAFHQGRPANAGAHSLLAAASGLLKTGQIKLDHARAEFAFVRPQGKAEVFVNLANIQHPILISQTISPSIDRFTPGIEEIASTIGLSSSDIASARYSTLIVSCGKPYLFVPLKSYHALREAAFHNREWSHSSLPQSLVDSLLLFAPNTDNKGGDFHARLLERNAGATSDPAIGEAMPAFAAYLCEQKSVQQGTHSFGVRRGANDGRQSLIQLEMDNEGTPDIKVRIGGASVVTSTAEILDELAV